MKIAVFVVGCVLALSSALSFGLCVVLAWFLQHPPSDLTAYSPPRAATTALGLVLFLIVAVLLGAVANLLIGIGAHGTVDAPASAGTKADPTGTRKTTAGRQFLPGVDAVVVALAIVVIALIISIVSGTLLPASPVKISLPANQGFTYFAAFYVVAQVVERFMEPFTWLLDRLDITDDSKKPNRTAIIHSLAVLVSVIISDVFNLHFLDAVGVTNLPTWVDSYATALIISGGTKPLHDFISYLQQTKDQATKDTG